ncbi:hypothetical protein [Pseudomonas chlororaphis]|uniref:hypothetical protein n=1 Tax=Pseudomonas chlororaphis TaxID=587753 RepID=UPI0005A690BE|nr:hypothetical protein [Pseudomonas chlororaphis]WDG46323.1 hypothetical protein PUP58_21560 [Pseudomonas chlororaphis]
MVVDAVSCTHVRIELSSQGVRGVFSGDMLHSPIQIPLWEWSSKVCENRALTAKSRFELLRFCVDNGALLLPESFEALHAGHIVDNAGTFGVEFLTREMKRDGPITNLPSPGHIWELNLCMTPLALSPDS